MDLGVPDLHRTAPNAPAGRERRGLGRGRPHRRNRRHPRPADLATRLGAGASYLLVALFWLAGAPAITIYRLAGGVEGAGHPLKSLSTAAP